MDNKIEPAIDTEIRVLAEIARDQPEVNQSNVANRVNITPQAVSKIVKNLIEKGFLKQEESNYLITKEGVDRLTREFNKIEDFCKDIRENVIEEYETVIAIADTEINAGDRIGLVMDNGVLKAIGDNQVGAEGYAVTSASKGEELRVEDISGIVDFDLGKVKLIKVPLPEDGGSNFLEDLDIIEDSEKYGWDLIAAVGSPGLAATNKIGLEPDLYFGVHKGVVDAAIKGLNVLVLGLEEDIRDIKEELDKYKIETQIITN